MELAQLKESLATLSAVKTEMASATSRSYASSASTYSGSGSGSYASAAKRSNLGQSAYGRRTRGRQPSNDADGATKRLNHLTFLCLLQSQLSQLTRGQRFKLWERSKF